MAPPSVLISGAGPTGLILALVLLQNGVSVRIIEKELKHRIGSRGSGVQPRTLELYNILGILPDIQKEGAPIATMAKYNPGEIEPSPSPKLPSGSSPPQTYRTYPNGLSISQERHEEILRDQLQKLSCSVELGSELRSFEQFSDHVVAKIVKTNADGKQVEESTNFHWLVGVDGARSIVHKQLGLSFLGETQEEHIALGDIAVEGVDPRFWHMWHVPPKLLVLRSSSSTSKVFMFAYTGRPEHLAENPPTREEFIEEFYDVTGRRDITFGPATWMSNWRPNLRMVDTMRSGRVFIAGGSPFMSPSRPSLNTHVPDATHCHSPTGGQGLNSSVQDAANLGGKLALVHKGLAPVALLDTYSEERIRVIAHMLKVTTELYHKMFSGAGPADPSAWKRGSDLNMLGVNYCGSLIVFEDAAGAGVSSDAYSRAAGSTVQAAYCAPDASGLVRAGSADAPTTLFAVFHVSMHTMLLFGGDAGAHAPVATVLGRFPEAAVRTVLVIPQGQTAADDGALFSAVLEDQAGHAYAGYGLTAGELAVVVVRPNGVVGAVVSNARGIERYFQKVLV
ncbi:monooxygenase [Mycena rosella]|uniref:Monooxygenase n=1 Tax=Mycena rosella TaxID=1033263 RepID=A0AAD7GPT9_MYCRO|nr:monooxygenase [Mycena rosella]